MPDRRCQCDALRAAYTYRLRCAQLYIGTGRRLERIRQRAVHERVAWQRNQPAEVWRRRQALDREAHVRAQEQQRRQQARQRQHQLRKLRALVWHALLIWPLFLADHTASRPVVCGAVILSLQLAFIMICHRGKQSYPLLGLPQPFTT